MSRPSFASRLNDAILQTGTVLCVGIDPHPDIMPPVFGWTGQNLASGQA
ncbi:MAG: orotidine 5'-phosphate decarboxylase, partial [Proteobacteria bacterium]|nr:orotidine 5'-phosphate decarboxylase [Pseudomonadota bacterium]